MAKEKKTDCNYEGKATLITARAKGNATLIAALSSLLLAGGNFLNDFLDRQHQRQLDESTYSAALAEIRSMKKQIATYHPPAPPAAAAARPIMSDDVMMDLAAESDAVVEFDAADEPAVESIAEPKPDRGMVQAPSFDGIKDYVQRSGKALRFEVAQTAD